MQGFCIFIAKTTCEKAGSWELNRLCGGLKM